MIGETRHLEEYVGDGAYVFLDDWGNVVLYTSNGIDETNRVVIDAYDVKTLESWLERAKEFVRVARAKQKEKEDADAQND